MTKKIYFALLIIGLFGCQSPYQLGLKSYDNLEFKKSIVQFEKVIEKNPNDQIALIKLADSYRKINKSESAEKYYAKALQISDEVEPVNYLYYANSLKSNQKYGMAKYWYAQYLLAYPFDRRAYASLNSCDSLSGRGNEDFIYKIGKLPLSPRFSHFSPTYWKDKIVFSSEHGVNTKDNPYNDKNYLDLVYISKDFSKDNKINDFSPKINSKFHEGPCAFNSSDNEIYFTRSNYNNRRRGKSTTNENNLKIYKSKYTEGTWQTPVELSFNSDEYSCGHPTLSLDGKFLYFVSDMPGTLGGTDLYKLDLSDPKLNKPVNLGKQINSEGAEMFPKIVKTDDGKEVLYWSSDGRGGIGGLDLYRSKLNKGTISEIEHLPFPINSYKDDFGVQPNSDGFTGLLSSNRDNDSGIDGIYSYNQQYIILAIQGKVINKLTKANIDQALIIISSKDRVDTLYSNAEGGFFYKVKVNRNYELFVNHHDYFALNPMISTIGLENSDTIPLLIELEPIILNKPIVLENIFYDFDKSNIREDAKPALNYLIGILEDNPEISIELGSHTDSRGSDPYNLSLSERRAKSAVDYIINIGGISNERIKAKGYGETVLVNKCANGVYCSPEDHQKNRRTEFKVTEIK